MVYANEVTGTAAAIGCVAEVLKHERHPEDRFTLVCKGQQRFRVHEIVRTKPYLVARVSPMLAHAAAAMRARILTRGLREWSIAECIGNLSALGLQARVALKVCPGTHFSQ